MANSNIESGLDLIGQFIVDQLKVVLIDKDQVASGELLESLRYEIKQSSGYEIIIYAVDYAKFVDQGTPPGTMVSVEALAKWVEAKGIATGEPQVKALAFAIQRKIFESGTIQFRGNKKGFIEVMLDENAKTIFEMVTKLFNEEVSLTLSNTIAKNRAVFEN